MEIVPTVYGCRSYSKGQLEILPTLSDTLFTFLLLAHRAICITCSPMYLLYQRGSMFYNASRTVSCVPRTVQYTLVNTENY